MKRIIIKALLLSLTFNQLFAVSSGIDQEELKPVKMIITKKKKVPSTIPIVVLGILSVPFFVITGIFRTDFINSEYSWKKVNPRAKDLGEHSQLKLEKKRCADTVSTLGRKVSPRWPFNPHAMERFFLQK